MTHRGIRIRLSNGLNCTVYCHDERNRRQLKRVFYRFEQKVYPTQVMLPGCPYNYFMLEIRIGKNLFHAVCYDNDGAPHLCGELARDTTVLWKKYLDAIVYGDAAYQKTDALGRLLTASVITGISPPILTLLNLGPRAMKHLGKTG